MRITVVPLTSLFISRPNEQGRTDVYQVDYDPTAIERVAEEIQRLQRENLTVFEVVVGVRVYLSLEAHLFRKTGGSPGEDEDLYEAHFSTFASAGRTMTFHGTKVTLDMTTRDENSIHVTSDSAGIPYALKRTKI